MDNPDLSHEKIQAEIAKLMAETSKINKESRYYPIVILGTIIIALGVILKAFVESG